MNDLIPTNEQFGKFRETLTDLKDNINFPDKGWMKEQFSLFGGKIQSIGELFDDDASDGDPTTALSEGEAK